MQDSAVRTMGWVRRASGGVVRRIAAWLPEGRALPHPVWARRHRLVCSLLWFHFFALTAFALIQGFGWIHSFVEGAIVGLIALVAGLDRLGRRNRTIAASLGLITCSAIFVHLSGGYIEAHFHFFVMVAVVAIYQDWAPFLLAIGFVAVHHGVMGVLSPASVYNHPDAIAHPWKWAGVHALFILAESAASVWTWRQNELSRAETEGSNEALLKALSQLEAAQHVAHVGSWEWDVGTNQISWSDELFSIFGVRPNEFDNTFEGYLGLLYEEDRDLAQRIVGQAMESGGEFEFHHRVVKYGEIRTLLSKGEVVLSDEGLPVRMFGTANDITDEIKASEAQARLAAIVISSNDAIVGWSKNGLIDSWNGGAEELFGYSSDEVMGIPTSLLAPADMSEEDAAILAKVMAGERVQDHQTQRQSKSGRVIDVSLTVSPVKNSVGAVVGAATIARDATKQKLAEAALRSALSREKETVIKLREVDSIKSDFISSVSHELRTPLTSINGYLELLAEDEHELNESQTGMLEVVGRNSKRLLSLIEDLLLISRVEAGAFKISPAPILLSSVVEELTKAVLPVFEKGQLGLSVDLPDNLRVYAHEEQLERVLLNLLTNASKFSRPGGRVTLTARQINHQAVISISDTGVGIPADEQSRLFDRFFRSSISRDMAIAGTGLGLAICKTIVERHGGSIWLRSEEGKGTTVSFTLPTGPIGEKPGPEVRELVRSGA